MPRIRNTFIERDLFKPSNFVDSTESSCFTTTQSKQSPNRLKSPNLVTISKFQNRRRFQIWFKLILDAENGNEFRFGGFKVSLSRSGILL
jgi:hypothetical protein